MIACLEADMLECEVNWALGSITTNKASGGVVIPVELFQILKDDAVKVLHSIWQQVWKTQQWSQGCKRSVFFFFSFIFISWRLITLQYCSGFCHTLTWINHGFTWIPHPDPPSHLPLYPIPLSLPSVFHSNLKERQCQRMFKPPHNCTHFTC